MALFGDPPAQEKDVERAAWASLSIQPGTGKAELNARIAIEIGRVVIDAGS